jgi:hypothetical protein
VEGSTNSTVPLNQSVDLAPEWVEEVEELGDLVVVPENYGQCYVMYRNITTSRK